MVLQYVDAHGQITRTEAADLCSLTPDQARRLLRRLAKERKLKLRGERRGSGWRIGTGRASERCVPSAGWSQASRDGQRCVG